MTTPIKSSTLRRLTKLAKSLHPLMTRIPAPLPRPGSDAYSPPLQLTAADAQKRQEAYERADSRRLDRETIRFWATPYGFTETRR